MLTVAEFENNMLGTSALLTCSFLVQRGKKCLFNIHSLTCSKISLVTQMFMCACSSERKIIHSVSELSQT